MEIGVSLETVLSHMFWSSARNQYICNQLQVFLNDLKMPQRLQFSRQAQNCDSPNPTNFCITPEFSRTLFGIRVSSES